MKRPSIARLSLLCSVAVVGCEGTSNPELSMPDRALDDLKVATNTQHENPLLGAWLLTSALVDDDELLAGTDFVYVLTFWGDGTFSVSVANDVVPWICKEPVQTSCEWTGTYTYTRTSITFDDSNHPDPDERGFDTGMYTPCAGRLIYMDDGDTKLTFNRARQDCYVRDCT